MVKLVANTVIAGGAVVQLALMVLSLNAGNMGEAWFTGAMAALSLVFLVTE